MLETGPTVLGPPQHMAENGVAAHASVLAADAAAAAVRASFYNQAILKQYKKAEPSKRTWLVEMVKGGSEAKKLNREALMLAIADVQGETDVHIRLCHVLGNISNSLGIGKVQIKKEEAVVYRELFQQQVQFAESKKVQVDYFCTYKDARPKGLLDAARFAKAERVYVPVTKKDAGLLNSLMRTLPAGTRIIALTSAQDVSVVDVGQSKVSGNLGSTAGSVVDEGGSSVSSSPRYDDTDVDILSVSSAQGTTPRAHATTHMAYHPSSHASPASAANPGTSPFTSPFHSSLVHSPSIASLPEVGLNGPSNGGGAGDPKEVKRGSSVVSWMWRQKKRVEGDQGGGSITSSPARSQTGGNEPLNGTSFSGRSNSVVEDLPRVSTGLEEPCSESDAYDELYQQLVDGDGSITLSVDSTPQHLPNMQMQQLKSVASALKAEELTRYNSWNAPPQGQAEAAQPFASMRERGSMHAGGYQSGDFPVNDEEGSRPPTGMSVAPGGRGNGAPNPLMLERQPSQQSNGSENSGSFPPVAPKARPSLPVGMNAISPAPQLQALTFTSAQVLTATSAFSPEFLLSSSPVGCLYHGRLSGCQVAVARLPVHDWKDPEAFGMALQRLAACPHPRVAMLMGGCSVEEKALVYFYPGGQGTLAHQLKGGDGVALSLMGVRPQPLSWAQRVRVLNQVAEGLTWLHAQQPPVCLGGGLSPELVMLDPQGNAQICLAGLASLGRDWISTQVWLESTLGVPVAALGRVGSSEPAEVEDAHVHACQVDSLAFGLMVVYVLTGLERGSDIVQDVVRGGPREVDMLSRLARCSAAVQGMQWPQEAVGPIAELAVACLDSDPEGRPSLAEIRECLVTALST